MQAQVGEGGSERPQAVEYPVASPAKGHGTACRCCSGRRQLSVEQAASLRPNRPIQYGWSYRNALVGEFMVAFLVLRTAMNSDFVYSSMSSLEIGLAVFKPQCFDLQNFITVRPCTEEKSTADVRGPQHQWAL